MQGPFRGAVTPAEDAHPTRRSILGGVEQHLHLAAAVAGPVLGVIVLEDQRTLQLHVLQSLRSLALGQARGYRHGAVERAGRDKAVEHAVVGQPFRVRGEDLRLEGDLAAGGFVAGAQQRMIGAGRTPPGGLDPVSLPLERIARERDAPAGFSGEKPREGDRKPQFVRPRHGGDERVRGLAFRYVAARPQQARNRDRRAGWAFLFRPGQAHHGPQHRVRTDLDHHVHTAVGEGLDRLPEGHRLTRLTPPVVAVEHVARGNHAAGQRADEVDRGRGDVEALHGGFQVVQRGLDQGTVVCGTPAQPPYAHIFPLEALEQGLHLVRRPAHGLVRPVVRGHAYTRTRRRRVVPRDLLGHPGRRREDRRHRPFAGQVGHPRASVRREPQSVFQAEHARRLRRRDFAQAVPDHHVGPNPDACPEGRQGALQRVDRGLLPRRVVEIRRRVPRAEHRAKQGGVPFRDVGGLATVEDLAGHGLGLVDLPAHAHPLAGLSGVGERDPRRLQNRLHRSPGIALGDRQETLAQRFGVAEHDPRPVGEVAAADPRCPGHVREQRVAGGLLRLWRMDVEQPGYLPASPRSVSSDLPERGRTRAGRGRRTSSARAGTPTDTGEPGGGFHSRLGSAAAPVSYPRPISVGSRPPEPRSLPPSAGGRIFAATPSAPRSR